MNSFTKKIVKLLKKLPIDIGQAERKHDSAGKKIACSFIPKVKRKSKKTALDIGCRDGYWSKWLESQGYKVTSLDIEPHYRGAIKHNIETGLPIKRNSFDIIFCTEVIEHLHNPKFVIKEIDRVLKKKGKSVLTTPNSNWFFYWILKPFGVSPASLQNADHKQFFTFSSVKKLCKNYKIFGYFPYAIYFWKISSLIGPLSPTFILVKKK
jgi:SAM-dependent methyltransferase